MQLRYSWLLAVVLISVAGVIPGEAGAYSKAAVAACQRASDDGDFRRTVAECGNLIKEPDVPLAEKARAYVNRCIAYFYESEDEHAIADCSAALDLAPGDMRALKYRGWAHIERAQYDDAIRDFGRVIETDPKRADAYILRGFAQYSKGALDAALQDYEQALKVGGYDGWAYYRRGTALMAKGDAKRALDDYARSIPLNAEDAPRYAAQAAFYLGRHAEAANYYAEISGSGPYDAFFHHLALRHAGRENAADVFDEIRSQLDPWSGQLARYFEGALSQADLLKAAADPDPATAAWQRCEATFYIGEITLIAGMKDEARQHFETAVKTCPKDYIELIAARAELARM